MRKEIEEFAEAMEKVMQKHDPEKGDSWKEMPLHTLEHLLLSEVREWNANRLGHIDGENHPKEKEVIDIANIAMMLWHRYRKEEKKEIWDGDVLLLRTPYTLETSSCVTFIKENGLQPYITNLTIQIPMSFVEPSNKHLNVLEEHYKHLIGLYCNDIFSGDDIAVAEVMITALANAIGILRGILKLPPSKVVTEYGDKLQEFIDKKRKKVQ